VLRFFTTRYRTSYHASLPDFSCYSLSRVHLTPSWLSRTERTSRARSFCRCDTARGFLFERVRRTSSRHSLVSFSRLHLFLYHVRVQGPVESGGRDRGASWRGATHVLEWEAACDFAHTHSCCFCFYTPEGPTHDPSERTSTLLPSRLCSIALLAHTLSVLHISVCFATSLSRTRLTVTYSLCVRTLDAVSPFGTFLLRLSLKPT
jgi:hypothetical protein